MWFLLGVVLIIGALALNAGLWGEPQETQGVAHWMFWIGVILFIVPLLFILGVMTFIGVIFGIVAKVNE